MNELDEIVKKLAEVEKDANIDLAGWDPRTRVAAETAKKTALELLEEVRSAYKAEISKNIVKVFVVGSDSKLAQLGKEVSVIAGDALYRQLADGVRVVMDPRTNEFGSAPFRRLIEGMSDLARGLDIAQLPYPKFDEGYINSALATQEELVKAVRACVRLTCSDDLNRVFLSRQILDALVAERTTAAMVPVFLSRLAPAEMDNLSGDLFFGRPSVKVDLDQVTAEDGSLAAAVRSKITQKGRATKKA